MISVIRGKIIFVDEQSIIVDVNNIGFQLYVPNSNSFSVESNVTFYTYFHFNQENGPTLFGFESIGEKKVFELIISCPGIGPKLALAMLRDLGAPSCLQAIASQDAHSLSKVSGIGQKKAEQVIVQLKDKAGKLLLSDKVVMTCATAQTIHLKEVTDALSSLGYSRQEITNAINHLHEQSEQHQYIFDQMFRKALSFLSKR